MSQVTQLKRETEAAFRREPAEAPTIYRGVRIEVISVPNRIPPYSAILTFPRESPRKMGFNVLKRENVIDDAKAEIDRRLPAPETLD